MTAETTHPHLTAGSPTFGTNDPALQPAEQAELDRAVAELRAHTGSWASLPLSGRIAILTEVQTSLQEVAETWVMASLEAKRVPRGGFAEAEEWILFGAAAHMVRRHREVLEDLQRHGRIRLPYPLTTHANGQVVAPLYPRTRQESLLFQGMRGEAWLEPGVGLEQAVDLPAWAEGSGHAARVVLVLGAGNAAMLPVADFLSVLFLEGHVVLLKMNPVNDYLGPIYQQAFQPLIRRGYLRLAYGGAAVGAYLSNHPQVDAVHLTGSDKTYDAVVFGPGAAGAARKAARQPLLDKPVTAELGGVNPLIVIPGPWTDRQVRRQALQLAGFLYSNASFNCLTPRVLIQSQGWSQRHQFLDAVGAILNQAGTRPAYYPGAEARYQSFVSAHPEAQRFGEPSPGCLPWTIARDVDPQQVDDPVFRSESFCSILGATTLAASNVVDYIHRAVEFANDVLWGTLTATILVHPGSLKDPAISQALAQALATLRYGTITVNTYPALAYVLMLMPWGAYPGHTPYDIQSGVGKVNNFYHLRQPQKAVFQAPFDGLQAGGLTSRRNAQFGRELAVALAQPSLRSFLGLTRAALLAM